MRDFAKRVRNLNYFESLAGGRRTFELKIKIRLDNSKIEKKIALIDHIKSHLLQKSAQILLKMVHLS